MVNRRLTRVTSQEIVNALQLIWHFRKSTIIAGWTSSGFKTREELLVLEQDETDELAAWKVKVKAVPVQEMRAYRGSGGTALLKTNIGARYRWAVKFTFRPFFLPERAPAPALLRYLVNVGRSGNKERQNRNCTSRRLKINCSGDTAFHACGSVTEAPPSLSPLRGNTWNGQPTNERQNRTRFWR
jgi:hypothetical protein